MPEDKLTDKKVDDLGPAAVAPPAGRLTLRQLEAALWDAACELRAPVGTDRCKDYILPILFYKRMSDTYQAEQQQAVAELGPDVSSQAEADYHTFSIPTGCLWADLAKVTTGINLAVSRVLMDIEKANVEQLQGVFSSIQWGNTDNLPENALSGLIRALSALDLSPTSASEDVIGRAYEYLLSKFAADSAKKAGEFYSPRSVVRLLVRIANPHLDDEILDPSCGSGGILLEAIQEVKEAGGDYRPMRLYGQEVRPDTAMIAKINMFLHGMEAFDIRRGDTLRDPLFVDGDQLKKFDIVLANPPFSLKNWGHENWATDKWGRCQGGVPPKGFGDFAFIQHMVASLKDKGRAAIIMNHGVLFRGGQEQKIRQWLVESDILDAVIDAPRELFFATTIPNSIFVFNKDKPQDRRGKVLFIDGTKRFQEGKKINDMSEEDIDAIIAAYQSGVAASDVRCRWVDHAELKENDYSFNFGIYLPSNDVIEKIDMVAAYETWRAAHEVAEKARLKMENCLEAGTSVQEAAKNKGITVPSNCPCMLVKASLSNGRVQSAAKLLDWLAEKDLLVHGVHAHGCGVRTTRLRTLLQALGDNTAAVAATIEELGYRGRSDRGATNDSALSILLHDALGYNVGLNPSPPELELWGEPGQPHNGKRFKLPPSVKDFMDNYRLGAYPRLESPKT